MYSNKTYQYPISSIVSDRASEYAALVKMRLSLLVVFSSLMGYVYASGSAIQLSSLVGLLIGGFFVTGAANTFNQLIEKDIDRLMVRTASRPLSSGRMSLLEGIFIGVLMVALGVWTLNEFTNVACMAFGLASLVIYSFIYTPLKRMGTLSVYIGAIPGAMPFILGWMAFKGDFTFEAGLLFLIQFVWQLPHTWSIAWLLNKDYSKVGIKMLPYRQNKTFINGMICFISAVILVPVALLPFYYGFTSWISLVAVILTGGVFVFNAFNLMMKREDKNAKKVLFASIVFLPVVQIAMVLDKLIF